MLSFGSGVPALGWGFAIIDILRDIDRDAYTKHIEPNLPVPSDANIAGFFADALGIGPEQYEKGNISAPIRGMGTDLSPISDILGVTKAFGEATGFSPPIQSLITSDGLSKYPVTKQNYSFDISKGRFGGRAIQKQQQEENEKELKKTEREKNLENTIAGDGDDNNEENPPIETRRKDGKKEGKNQWWDFFDVFRNPTTKDGESVKDVGKEVNKAKDIIRPKSIMGLISLNTNDIKAHIVVRTVYIIGQTIFSVVNNRAAI